MRSIALASLLLMSTAACGAAVAQTAPASSQPAPAQTSRNLPAAPADMPRPVAVAALKTSAGSEAGFVSAYRGPQGWLFKVEGEGWPEGWHGVHLHSVGTCEGPGFTSAGAHINHEGMAHPHGLLNANGGPDLGDLQNVYAAADGRANAEVYLAASPDAVPLLGGDGVSFLVHANNDDHYSQPIGGAGDRIACGVFEEAAVTGQ